MTSLNSYLPLLLAYITDVRGRSTSTSNAYRNDLVRFITYLGERNIATPQQVSTEMIENYLQEQQTTMTTKARSRSAITTFFRFLIRRGAIVIDPCLNLETIKIVSKEPTYLTPDQSKALVAAARRATPYYRARDVAIVHLFLKSGIRRAELAGLNVEDVSLEMGTMRVLRKGGRSQTLPLHRELKADLATYLAHIERISGPLFLSKRHGRLSASELWHLIRKYSKQAGLPHTTSCHTLRHTFASTLLAQDVQLRYIQSLLNHKNLNMTAKYLHFQDGKLLSALSEVTF
jgi:site-specific recombinase XerD